MTEVRPLTPPPAPVVAPQPQLPRALPRAGTGGAAAAIAQPWGAVGVALALVFLTGTALFLARLARERR